MESSSGQPTISLSTSRCRQSNARQLEDLDDGSCTPPSCSSGSVQVAVKKRLPILKWLPKYKKVDLLPDAVSGFSVCLTAVPQSIAYANVAGVTPEYGLYSSFVSCFVYLFLGSCRQMTIGPTALMELLVYETCGPSFPSCVILVGFWVGIVQLLMGLLKLGAVVSLISDPVTIGFVGGASLTIASSQIKSFFGLTGPKGDGFVDTIKVAIENISSARLGDSLMGACCVIILVVLKNLKDYVKPSTSTSSGKVAGKLIWILTIGRNALVVVSATALAAILNNSTFALTGTVKSGFPPVQPPPFELPVCPDGNTNSTSFGVDDVDESCWNEYGGISSNGTLTFWDTMSKLRTAPLTIAVISILQNVAIAKAFGSGQSIDATQEMIALGVSHIVASFFSALPTAGSFTRSAVNEASGVRSPAGGIVTGLLVIFALSFLTQWFAYIPKASLAAVILCAVLPMIEYETILPMWKISKLDVLTTIVTFLASLLLGMEYGIIIGVGVSLALYLIRPVRPRVAWSIMDLSNNLDSDKSEESSSSQTIPSTQEKGGDDNNSPASTAISPLLRTYHLVKPEQGFSFPSVDALRTMINKLALKHPEINMIVLDCGNMITMDYTSASALVSLVKALKKTGKSLVFIDCKKYMIQMFETVGLNKPECYDSLQDLEKSIKENLL